MAQPRETNVLSMLEGLFAGHVQHMERSNVLLERLWSLEELDYAVHRSKMHKCGDDGEPIAEMQNAETCSSSNLGAFIVSIQ